MEFAWPSGVVLSHERAALVRLGSRRRSCSNVPSPVPCQVPHSAAAVHALLHVRVCMGSCGPAHRLGLRELGAHKNVSNRNADATPLLRRVGDGATVDFDEGLKVARGWSVVFVPRFAARLLLLAKTALKSWAEGRP